MSRSRDGASTGDSSRAGAGSGGGAGAQGTVLLPNIPRTTDEKSKIKYMTDYEKYEPELRKHHLGAPDATTTVGLKDIATEFCRAIPSLSDPTAAECEYERGVQLRAKPNSRNRSHSSSKPKASRAAAAGGCTTSTDEPAGWGSAAADASPGAAGSEGGAADKSGRGGTNKNGTATKTVSINVPTGKTPTAPGGEAVEGQVAKKPRRVDPPGVSTAPPGRVASVPGATSRSLSSQASPPNRQPPLASAAVKGGEVAAPNASAKPKPKGVRAETAPLLSPKKPPSRQGRVLLEEEKAFFERAIQQPFAFANRTAAPVPADYTPPSADVAECAAVLHVLVDTPEEFMASFHLDTDFFDLDWLKGNRSKPAAFTTIQNTNLARGGGGGRGNAADRHLRERLNSPRSVLAMLRNGASLEDLRPSNEGDDHGDEHPHGGGSMKDPSKLLPDDPELRAIVRKYRTECDNSRREQLLGVLQNDYLALCQQVPLPDLVAAFSAITNSRGSSTPAPLSGAGGAKELPTSVAQRIEQQQKIFATNMVRLQKQVDMMVDVREHQEAAEERKAKAEEEAKAAAAQKAQEELEARLRQQERLEAQRRKNAEMEAVYKERLAERMYKAELRNQERIAAQALLNQKRQEERAAAMAERRERFERNAELQAAQAAELEQRRQAKEAKLEEINREREARMLEYRRDLEERQAKAEEAREAARRRAEKAQAALHDAALEKQLEVQARLEEFQRRRAEERALKVHEEAAKGHRRTEALASAQQQQHAFRDRIQQRAENQDAALEELQRQRALERTIKVEREREAAALRHYAVRQKQRMDEYGKLRTIARLLEKRAAADYVTKEREAIVKQTLKARDAFDAEKERLRHALELAERKISTADALLESRLTSPLFMNLPPPSSAEEEGVEDKRVPSLAKDPPELELPAVGLGRQQQQQQPSVAPPVGFAGVTVRPPGSRYGDADLLPGGSLDGGMHLGAAGVRRMVGQGEAFDPPSRGPDTRGLEDHIRFDPIFPGQPHPCLPSRQPQPWNPQGPGPGRAFPGEPDPDHLLPLQGGRGQPFGGPGGGQFGPRGFGGPGGGGGFNAGPSGFFC